MLYHVRGGRDGRGVIEIYTNRQTRPSLSDAGPLRRSLHLDRPASETLHRTGLQVRSMAGPLCSIENRLPVTGRGHAGRDFRREPPRTPRPEPQVGRASADQREGRRSMDEARWRSASASASRPCSRYNLARLLSTVAVRGGAGRARSRRLPRPSGKATRPRCSGPAAGTRWRDCRGDVRVVRAEDLLPDGQGAPEERLGLREAALRRVQRGEIIQGRGGHRVLGAEDPRLDRQGRW